MATFKVQIEDITGAVGDDNGLTQWLTDGAKEIINILPSKLKEKCATISIVNATNGTTLDMDAGGEILQVTRLSANSGGYQIPCRNIHPMYGDLTNDSASLYYATVTDPVYWITSNSSGVSTLFVKPTATDSQPSNVYRVAYPSVANTDSVIANFPNEAEYLVVLYAAIKGLHRLQNDLNSNSDITTAFTYAKAGLDQAETALDKFEAADGDSIFGDEATFLTADSQLAHVSDALIKAQNLIDGATMGGDTEPQSAQYWLNDEDTEMVQATLQTAQSEIQRAQTSIQHWVSIGDMRAKQANAALAEANGYIAEAKIRMERDSQKYQWYQVQQVKLQQDYDKGIAMLVSQGIPQPAKQERAR